MTAFHILCGPRKASFAIAGEAFVQQLNTLAPDLGSSADADPSDVAAGMSKALCQTQPDRVAGKGYDRNAGRRCLKLCDRGADREYDIGVAAHHIRRQCVETGRVLFLAEPLNR